MKKTSYKSIFIAFIPIGVILFLVLKSELKTEGYFGGLVGGFKYLFFLVLGILVFFYTSVKQGKKIKRKSEVREAKIILTLLLISTFLAISSFWFPKDFYDKEPEFVANDKSRTLLTLADGKYMLRTYDYEWTTIDRGFFKIKDSIIILEEKVKEKNGQKELKNI